MKTVRVSIEKKEIKGSVQLAGSKSESNRSLIIKALAGNSIELSNLANARDTETMIRLLSSSDDVLDVLDAGTTMRFLTAYTAVKGSPKTLTGSSRMKERPIALLVDALRSIGAQISYLENEGFPPIHIHGFDKANKNNKITIRGDVSSQYISALLMVAPTLPNGLEIELTGKIGSRPYIEMTLNQMQHFGVSHTWTDNVISIQPQQYTSGKYSIEADWSGASYWYSIAALATNADITLGGLRKTSNQGDSVLAEMMPLLGVSSEFLPNDKVRLTSCTPALHFEWDFTHCPDIAQTIAVICAAKGISAKLTGLESLRIKETDRIAAIVTELAKFGTTVEVVGDEEIIITNPTFHIQEVIPVATYKDHRMAMAFAPLALVGPVRIENPDVVDKSYPDYWRDLSSVGFHITDC